MNSGRKYRFVASSIPMVWVLLDVKTGDRIPGQITMMPVQHPHRFTYRRQYRYGWLELTAPTVDTLDARIAAYYERHPDA